MKRRASSRKARDAPQSAETPPPEAERAPIAAPPVSQHPPTEAAPPSPDELRALLVRRRVEEVQRRLSAPPCECPDCVREDEESREGRERGRAFWDPF